jgi:hypothetical protein
MFLNYIQAPISFLGVFSFDPIILSAYFIISIAHIPIFVSKPNILTFQQIPQVQILSPNIVNRGTRSTISKDIKVSKQVRGDRGQTSTNLGTSQTQAKQTNKEAE